MDSCNNDDEWMNFVPLKRRKVELEFTNSVTSPVRKITRKNNCKKKKNVNLKAKVDSMFCPSCQLPFKIQIPTTHVLECIDTDWKNIPECSNGVTCKDTVASHFREFSHFALAAYRSAKNESIYSMSLITSVNDNISPTMPSQSKNEDKVVVKIDEEESSSSNECFSQFPDRESPRYNTIQFVKSPEKLSPDPEKDLSSSSSQKENESSFVVTAPQKNHAVKSPQKVKSKRTLSTKKEIGQCDIRSFLNQKSKIEHPPVIKNNEKTNELTNIQPPTEEKPQWSVEWWKKTDEKKFDIQESDIPCGKNFSKKCPFYKKIPDTSFAVDAFSYGLIENVNYYFLTHFHSDHYRGLTGKFKGPVYCTQVTANLVHSQLRVPLNQIHVLSITKSQIIDNIEITLIDANHCPGSVMFLFRFPNGRYILHTGDFRANSDMETHESLKNIKIDALYLDTTYCHPRYDFPLQDDVVKHSVVLARKMITENSRTLIVCGSYSIGKEKIFKAIAEELHFKVCGHAPKIKLLSMLEDSFLSNILTRDWNEAQIHVLPMHQLSFNNLNAHLQQHGHKFDKLIAFKPTGWEYKGNKTSLVEIKPRTGGKISIYGLPYSEHSSFVELRRFVQFIKPGKIIPTVNVGKPEERNRMQRLFEEWMKR